MALFPSLAGFLAAYAFFWSSFSPLYHSQSPSSEPPLLQAQDSLSWRGLPPEKREFPSVRTRSTTTRDRNLHFRGAVSTGSFEFSPVDFSTGFLCNLVRKSPQNVEKIARFLGGEKSAESGHVPGMAFSVPTKEWRAKSGLFFSNSHQSPLCRTDQLGQFPSARDNDPRLTNSGSPKRFFRNSLDRPPG